MDRTMLNEVNLLDMFWRESINTTVYTLNRGKIRVNNNKTPYELWKGRPTTVKYFKVFGRKCYMKRDDEELVKFESIDDEGILLGYLSIRKAYQCYNKALGKILESSNVKVDESGHQKLKENVQTKDPSFK